MIIIRNRFLPFKGFEAMKRQIRKDMVRNLLLSQVQVTKKGDIISHFP